MWSWVWSWAKACGWQGSREEVWGVAGPLRGDQDALDLGRPFALKGQPPQLSSLGGEEMGCQTCRLWEVGKGQPGWSPSANP